MNENDKRTSLPATDMWFPRQTIAEEASKKRYFVDQKTLIFRGIAEVISNKDMAPWARAELVIVIYSAQNDAHDRQLLIQTVLRDYHPVTWYSSREFRHIARITGMTFWNLLSDIRYMTDLWNISQRIVSAIDSLTSEKDQLIMCLLDAPGESRLVVPKNDKKGVLAMLREENAELAAEFAKFCMQTGDITDRSKIERTAGVIKCSKVCLGFNYYVSGIIGDNTTLSEQEREIVSRILSRGIDNAIKERCAEIDQARRS